ncbi:MAG: MOSC domain-containing protein [Sedimentitalea sp.]
MTASVTAIWRHPIKSHGREPLKTVTMTKGQTMPGDRIWAVAHEQSDANNSKWSPCAHFSRVSKTAGLMAITSQWDEKTGKITLSHPELTDLTFNPDQDPDSFLQWVDPLMDKTRAMPARFVKVPGRGMTDSDFPSVTLCNLASHTAVEQQLGQPLSLHRWRGNIWFDTQNPWEEFSWLGKEVQIGEAILKVREFTDRCKATTASPDTGRRDVNVLAALDHFGHQDFSVRAEVVRSGKIAFGDPVRVP